MPDFGGLLSRIGSGIRSGVNKAQESLMPEPKGLEGLLSAEDIATARRQGMLNFGMSLLGDESPHFGQALAHGLQSAQGAYGNSVNQTMQSQMVGHDARQKMEIIKARQNIAQQFPPRMGETPEQTIDRMKGMFAAYMSAGDLESAGKLGEVLKSIGQPTKGAEPAWQDFGGYKALMTPDGRELQRVTKTPTPRDPNAPDTAAQLRMQRNFQREEQITDDYNKDTKAQRESALKIRGAIGETERAMKGDGVAQVNMLYAFVNSMDPTSAVREGEIGLARAAAPLWQQANGYLTKITSGQAVLVPPATIKQMSDLMARRYRSYHDYVKERSSYYGKRAKNWGVDGTVFPLLDPLEETSSSQTSRLEGVYGKAPKK